MIRSGIVREAIQYGVLNSSSRRIYIIHHTYIHTSIIFVIGYELCTSYFTLFGMVIIDKLPIRAELLPNKEAVIFYGDRLSGNIHTSIEQYTAMLPANSLRLCENVKILKKN